MRRISYAGGLSLLVFSVLLTIKPAMAQKYVCMQAIQGEWCMELLRSAAPNTVTNFLRYVNNRDYTNNLIHRSAPGFVIQGGGFSWSGTGPVLTMPTYGTINNEYSRPNTRGTVAMAKIGGNPNSASNQWFINLVDNSTTLGPNNNGGFTVFAEVVYGMEVIDRIASFRLVDLTAATGNGALGTVPTSSPPAATSISYPDLAIVQNAYASDTLPYHCTPNVTVEAFAELCGSAVTFAVELAPSGQLFRGTLDIVATQPNIVLRVRPGSLASLSAKPAVLARFDNATGMLTVPSVRVGASIFTDVQLQLVDASKLDFALGTYKIF